MDLYQKNPQTLRKLLAKRQNPCTQIFKSQPSTLSSEPITAMNLTQKVIPTSYETSSPQVLHNAHITVVIMPTSSSPSNSPNSTESASEDQQSNTDEDGDCAPLQERLQKKVKPTPKDKLNNKSNYEEEREESTSCETHSDEGTVNQDIPDFFLSPIMQAQKANEQKFEEFRLDDDFNNSFFSSSCDEDANALKGAQEFAGKYDSLCYSNRSCLIGSKLKFKCKFNHQWNASTDDFKKKCCPRCEELLKDFKDFAMKNGGNCTNQKYDETITFSCHKGHSWKLNHKNAKKRWCLDCQKEEKVNLKKKCEEERAERQRQEEEYQRNLFEEARKKAMEDSNSQSQGFMRRPTMNQPVYQASSVLEYFQRMDYEIEKLAQKYSLEFMSRKEFTGDIGYQQILQVYKILIMPEEILQNYMFSLGADTLKSEFRRIAKIIHPDKNKHPQAGTAFQKVYKVYEVALVRIDAAQKI
jgi:hypothetical protein